MADEILDSPTGTSFDRFIPPRFQRELAVVTRTGVYPVIVGSLLKETRKLVTDVGQRKNIAVGTVQISSPGVETGNTVGRFVDSLIDKDDIDEIQVAGRFIGFDGYALKVILAGVSKGVIDPDKRKMLAENLNEQFQNISSRLGPGSTPEDINNIRAQARIVVDTFKSASVESL